MSDSHTATDREAGAPWSFRGVQLDLARQMETLGYIEAFTDFIAAHGFNTLVLYLEGRVRTRSFPYPKDGECYTPDEMKAVVRYAAARGIDVVPVVPNLAHAEHFLRYPELAHLDELRGGREGRVSSSRHNVCPSLPEARAFFEAYYTELAAIFPSPFFHVGMDECFDIGACDLCRARAERGEGQAGIFAQHLIDTHAVIAGKLGRRMIVWDDLFEHYQEALERIPRDIVMCCWQYGAQCDLPVAHFNNLIREDSLALYRRLGYAYLVAPRELCWRNTAGLTAYAHPHQPLGGLVTAWERSRSFLHGFYPNIAFAGHLWKTPERAAAPEPVLAATAEALFPGTDAAFRDALWGALGTGHFQGGSTLSALLRPAAAGRRHERRLLNRYLADALACRADDPMVEDLRVELEREALQLDLNGLAPRVYELLAGGSSAKGLVASLQACSRRADALLATRRRQWTRFRPGIASTGDAMERYWAGLRETLAQLTALAADEVKPTLGILVVEYFLPDAFSCQWVSLAVGGADDDAWTTVVEKDVPKPLHTDSVDEYEHSGFFRVYYPVDVSRPLTRCRIATWGYGGMGVRSLRLDTPAGTREPVRVGQVVGMVDQPQYLLDNATLCCRLGVADTGMAMRHPGLARVRHGVTVFLEPRGADQAGMDEAGR